MTGKLAIAQNTDDLLFYQTEDCLTRMEVRLQHGYCMVGQVQMAGLFQTTKQNINLHIKNIFTEYEPQSESTVKKYLTVQTEGKRAIQSSIEYYNLDVLISVGYRIKSHRSAQFRNR